MSKLDIDSNLLFIDLSKYKIKTIIFVDSQVYQTKNILIKINVSMK